RRPRRRHALLRALPVRGGVRAPRDGVRLGLGVGPVRRRLRPDAGCAADQPPARALRGGCAVKAMRRAILYAALLAGSVILMFPLWWMTAISLSTEAEARKAMTSGGVMVWPESLEWSNYPEALQRMGAAAARTEALSGTGAGEEAGGASPDVAAARAGAP